MNNKNSQKLISISVLSVALIISSVLAVNAQTPTSTDANATSPISAVTFPIPELGNCSSREACKSYCDSPANAQACLDFAQSHNLMKIEDVTRARKVSELIKNGGPGGCTTKDQCKTYCSNSIHGEECVAFAEKNGIMKGKELNEAKKVLPFLKSGQTPGGCTTKEECRNYCVDTSHKDDCVAFAKKAGLLSREESDIINKTGGKGPGGCTSKDSCETFCNEKDNQQTCLDFAKTHNLIPAEKLKQIEEGTAKIRIGLSQFPGEVVQCLKDKIGTNAVGQIESGKLVPNKDIGDTIQSCFNEFKPKIQAKIQEGLKNAPAEVTDCLQTVLGSDGLRKMKSGNVDTPEIGDKIKSCFEKMKEQAKQQTQEGAQRMNQIPSEARDCVKQKLGGDIFEKMQSGDLEAMKNTSQSEVQSAVMSCMSQFKPTIPGGANGAGPSQDQINEMMRKGTPPSSEDIRKMMKDKMPQGIPSGFQGGPVPASGGPTPEQIQQMMQQGRPR